MSENMSIFTYCRPKWDEPSGFLALASLMPRVFSQLWHKEHYYTSSQTTKKCLIKSLYNIAQLIGWNEESMRDDDTAIFIDSYLHTKVRVFFQNSPLIISNKLSIKDSVELIQNEATRTKEIFFCMQGAQENSSSLIFCTATTLLFLNDDFSQKKINSCVCYHNMKAGIAATSEKYSDRSISLIPYDLVGADSDSTSINFGHCLILERIIMG